MPPLIHKPPGKNSRDSSARRPDESTTGPLDSHAPGFPPWIPLLAAMVFGFLMVLPALIKGNASGHDFEFHLASWMEVARQWHDGILYPRWAPGANFGYGEPRFIFYPPISWILGAALGTILPWPAVPGAFAWGSLTIAGLSAYRLVREWQPQAAALWAAALYVANPYNLINLYVRSAFGELLASALFPLVLLYALRLESPMAHPSGEKGSGHESILPLTLVVAAIWLTNAPSGVITMYALALLLVVAAVRSQSFVPLLRGGLAAAAGLALSGFYIVPALYEQKWVHISEAFTGGLRPQDNFPFTWWIGEEHYAFNFVISWVQMAELALAALVFVAGWRASRQLAPAAQGESANGTTARAAGESSCHALFSVLCMGTAAAILLLRPTLPLWLYLPFLKNVQFPWRLLLVLNLALSFSAVIARGPSRFRHTWKLLTLLVWLILNGYLLTLPIWEGTDVKEYAAAVDSDAGYESVEEYVPIAADRDLLQPGAPQLALADPDSPPDALHFKIERWQAEERLIVVEASQPVRLKLRLLNYPAWEVSVNGAPAAKESHPDTGQLIVSVPTGSSRVRVRFRRTADRSAGAALSLAALAFTAALFFAGRQRHPN